jgi:putative membrane protein
MVLAAPRASTDLQKGDTVIRKPIIQAKNETKYRFDLFRFHGSVIPTIWIPATLITLWGVLWTVLLKVFPVSLKDLAVPPQLIAILGVVMGLLLVFRTNTAYDRYWEARRLWGTLFTHTRNLSRFVWITVKAPEKKDLEEKYGALNLLLAFVVSTKHYLRFERGHHYEDLHNLLIHLPEYQPGAYHPDVDNLPLEVSFHISSFISRCKSKDLIDPVITTQMMNALSAMIDILSNLERIRDSPVPIAYTIHLKQTLWLYLLSLPFQLVGLMHYATIGVVAIASFTLLGLEAIGHEIENPFGYDDNDLHLEAFCEQLKVEMIQITDRPFDMDGQAWSTPVQLGNFEKLQKFSTRKRL